MISFHVRGIISACIQLKQTNKNGLYFHELRLCCSWGFSLVPFCVFCVLWCRSEVGLGDGAGCDPVSHPACSSGRWGRGCAHSCACDPATGACSCQLGFTRECCQFPKCPPPQHMELPNPSSASCVFLMIPPRDAPRLFRPCSARRSALGFQQG